MPTEPSEHMLNPESDTDLARPAIEIASPVLREAVNYATKLYERCRMSSKAENEEAFPVLVLYLHIIQMIDSMEVLISNSCVEPAQLLLRSAFEAKLSLEFMVEKMRRTRAIAWIVRNILDGIEFGQRRSEKSDKSKDFFQTLEKEGLEQFNDILPPTPRIPDDYMSKLEGVLEKPEYVDLNKEYKRLATKRQRVEWYSLFGGPINIRELAKYLGQQTVYDSLYRKWSKITHAANSDHLTLLLKDGKKVLGPIRNPLNIPHISNFALGVLLQSDQIMITQFLSGDLRNFSKWYKREMMQKHLSLFKMELEHLKWFENTFVKDTDKT